MGNEGFWRVYREEWTVAYVSDADGEEGALECREKFRSSYEGRVRPDGWRVVAWNEKNPGGWPWMLEIRLPVMKGEHVREQDADCHARETGAVVAREGSPEEREILRHQDELKEGVRKTAG
jgi:hypothetical protein